MVGRYTQFFGKRKRKRRPSVATGGFSSPDYQNGRAGGGGRGRNISAMAPPATSKGDIDPECHSRIPPPAPRGKSKYIGKIPGGRPPVSPICDKAPRASRIAVAAPRLKWCAEYRADAMN